ncbi:hypothetical protein CEQ90_18855 [Lewinellaceae bacterium SD302]|nr:hypothetical protein CEQ90_18855 [Lewinellaceae bacterium SD302]
MHLHLLNLVLQVGSLAIILLVIGVGWKESLQSISNNSVASCGVETGVKENLNFSTVLGGEAREGKRLWNENACGACHIKNMKDNGTGPALGGVTERWAAYPRADLYKWIQGSQAMIETKHPRALKLWENWAPMVMQNYPKLTDEEVEHLLAYIEVIYTGNLKAYAATP